MQARGIIRGILQGPKPRATICGQRVAPGAGSARGDQGFALGVELSLLFPLMLLHKVFHNFLKKQKHNPSA